MVAVYTVCMVAVYTVCMVAVYTVCMVAVYTVCMVPVYTVCMVAVYTICMVMLSSCWPGIYSLLKQYRILLAPIWIGQENTVCAMALAVTRRPFTAEASFPSLASLCGICDEQSVSILPPSLHIHNLPIIGAT
jgi:hypothetical protein